MAGGDKGSSRPSPARGPKTGRTLWITAIVFASAWMFFLGVLVGRGTAPIHFEIQDLKKELARAREALFKGEIKRFKIPAESQETPADLSFYDALRETKKRPAVKTDKPETQKTRVLEKSPAPESRVESTVKTPPGLEDGGKETQNTEASMNNGTDAPGKRLTLQVASLPSQKDARDLVEDLKKRGFPAYFEAVMIPGKGVWYRIRIGFFNSREEASSMSDRLKKERFQPMIVNRNSQ